MWPNRLARRLGVSLIVALIVTGGSSNRTRAQTEALRLHGTSSFPGIGRSISFLGDLNGDGVPDYVAGGPSDDDPNIPAGTGHAMVFSGADGSLLFEFVGEVGTSFGAAVASAGDVDGDGVDDVAVGAPMNSKGKVYVYSGATGVLVRTITGTSAGSRLGSSLASLGDVDGDGVADLAVGAPNDKSNGAILGLAVIYSGRSGAVLAQWNGSSDRGQFGSVVADAGDVDLAGRHDLLVVEQADRSSGPAVGTARVFSSETQTLLYQRTLGPVGRGWTASGAGDVNGDGVVDLIVGNDYWPFTWINYPYYADVGGVWVLDGATGATLYSYTSFPLTGAAVCAAGDVDGDGFADFAIQDWNVVSEVQIFSGSTGATLAVGATNGVVTSLQGGVDVNGDGVADLAVGVSSDKTGGPNAGAAEIFDPVQQTFIRQSFGDSRADLLGRTSALLDDVNGDGTRDLLVGTGTNTVGIDYARVLSGVDGSELRVHAGASTQDDSYALSVAALPDLDGDAIGEYAIAVPGPMGQGKGLIEVRAGATGNLLQSLAPAGGSVGQFGLSLAAAIQPSGAIQLAVGDPAYTYSGIPGKFYVFDPASGSTLLTVAAGGSSSEFGSSAAWLGDMNGDGVGDWAVGTPRIYSTRVGSVVIINGANGNVMKVVTSTTRSALGYAMCAAGDVDGDGTPDLYVGAPLEGPYFPPGSVYLYSGATWSVLRSWNGTGRELGSSVTAIGDVNRDGVDDVLFGEWDRAFLISGATGGQLYRFDPGPLDETYAPWSAGVAAPGSNGSMNGDAIPDVAIGGPYDKTNGNEAGRLSLCILDDLYLQIDPPSAPAGVTVTMTTSGGPSAALAMLTLLAFDSTPLFVPLGFGSFDSVGIWSLTGTVPPGLSGHSLTLASYGIGFNGKVVDTQPMPLAFE